MLNSYFFNMYDYCGGNSIYSVCKLLNVYNSNENGQIIEYIEVADIYDYHNTMTNWLSNFNNNLLKFDKLQNNTNIIHLQYINIGNETMDSLNSKIIKTNPNFIEYANFILHNCNNIFNYNANKNEDKCKMDIYNAYINYKYDVSLLITKLKEIEETDYNIKNSDNINQNKINFIKHVNDNKDFFEYLIRITNFKDFKIF